MKARVGRILCLVLITAGLGTASLATPLTAAATATPFTSTGPTAVAVGARGTTYVGFATGGRLAVLGPQGGGRGTVPLDRDEPVDGLAVTADGALWVDYGTGASLLSPRGRVLDTVEHRAGDCAGHPASRYGGIAVGGGRVWVANRCDDTITVYSPGGRRLAVIDLPGTGHPRGIAYGAPQSGRGATVYVALPDSGRVVAYAASRLSAPWRVVRVDRPPRGVAPRPAGLAVDRFGQLAVTDAANNAVYLLDSNHGFDRYRVLGHPPRAGRALGRLDAPAAVAQFAQDGGAMSGNLFIADSGNGRIQRWNTSGYSYWAEPVRAAGRGSSSAEPDGEDDGEDDGGGEVGDGPVSSTPPRVLGTPTVGQTVTCDPGSWFGSVGGGGGALRFAYGWRRDGSALAATTASYALVAADAGTAISCVVTVSDRYGSTTVASRAVTVAALPGLGPPVSLTPPTAAGAASVGTALECDPGTWTGVGVTYRYRWVRDGVAVPHSAWSRYVVLGADVGRTLACVVTATSADGSRSATSVGRYVEATSTPVPVATLAPSVTGSLTVGRTLTCSPGAWTGSPTISTVAIWLRDGEPVANGTWTHEVVAADIGTAVQCLVVATNGYARGAARSSPATVDACVGPTGVEIDGGAARTTEPLVELALRAPSGSRTVEISHDPGFAGGTVVPLPADCTLDWLLPSVPGLPLSWTVYVRFGGSSTVYSDDIVVDQPS